MWRLGRTATLRTRTWDPTSAPVRQLTPAIGAGLLGGLAASLCCVPAALFFALGLGGSAFLVGLGLYKVPFMALGLGITALAAWLHLAGRLNRTCAAGDRPRMRRSILSSLLGFVLAYLVLVYGIVPLLYQVGLGT